MVVLAVPSERSIHSAVKDFKLLSRPPLLDNFTGSRGDRVIS